MKFATPIVATALMLVGIIASHAAVPVAQCVVDVDPRDTLNVRTRPNGPITAELTTGTPVKLYDRDGDWVFATSDRADGWIYLPHLRSCRDTWGR
jgi:hypothetical protein